jgi:hypothetical protein
VSTIDRIRYYDGEFLRAFDYSDEQAYHVEMRRRINRYLHVCGIVRGLTLSSDTQGGVTEVSILPGMAIDAYGREIYLFAPYTLGDDDVTNSRITQAATYDVWLRYQKAPSTPPSSGYGNCNQANQYTRWEETFTVVLLPNPSSPFSPPGFADADDDDPSQDKVGVLLGTVYVDPTSATETFSSPLFDSKRCVLLGLIAQSIQAPPPWDAAQGTPPFSFLNSSLRPNTALSPPVSLDVQPNIFAEQNLIVGKDFVLTSAGGTTVTIQPSPTVSDPGAGSVKVAGDLFVQGNIYSLITSTTPAPAPPPPIPPPPGTNLWLDISARVQALVQQSMPDFLVGTSSNVTVAVTANNGNYVSDTVPISVTSTKIAKVRSFVAYAFVSQFQFDTQTNVDLLAGKQVQLAITAVTQLAPVGNTCTVNVSWTAGPATGVFSAIANFTLTGVFICFP